MFAKIVGTLLFLVHAVVVVASLAGPALVLIDTFHQDGRFTLAAWWSVFGDLPRWGTLLTNTAKVAGIATSLCLVLGIVFAALLFRTDIHLRRPAIALLLLAATIPLYVVSASAYSIIGKERWLGVSAIVGLIHAVAYLPLVVLIVGVAMRSVSADVEEMALLDGARPAEVFLRVTLPLAAGGLVASVVLVVLWVTTDYTVSDVLVVRTFAEEVYTQYALGTRKAVLVCVPQVLVFGGLLWGLRRGFLTGETDDGGERTSTEPYRFRVGRRRIPLSIAVGAAALALAATPVLSLAARVHHARDLAYFARLFTSEILTSVCTSLAAAFLAAALGVGLAWYAVRRPRWRLLIAAFVIAMLAVPAPVLGMGLILLFNRGGPLGEVYNSPGMLVIAYLFRFLPIAVILLIPAVRTIPPDCESAAKVDGCGALQTWWRIIWPLCLPSALVAMFAVTVLSIGELPCSLLVTPPGYNTVGFRFFGLIHAGLYPDAAALCLFSIGAVLVPWAALLWLLRKRLLS